MKYVQAKQRAEILKALAHPVRVILIDALHHGERCVCDLHRMVTINQSNVSRHLAVLKKAGIVTDRRDGMKVFYRLLTPCVLKAFDCAVNVVQEDSKRRQALAGRI